MAAPYVSVTINDQSIYADPSPSTIPLIVFATRGAKSRPDTSDTAVGTLEANKLRLISSQRELIQTYGNPVFVTSDGVPVHGDETNEYGLLTAHSLLGITNRAYMLRADIDLGQLVPNVVEPVLPAPDGTLWLNSGTAVAGLYQYNGTAWVKVEDYTSTGANTVHFYTHTPVSGDGVNGDWAFDYSDIDGTIYFKKSGTWTTATNAHLVSGFTSGATISASPTQPGTTVTGAVWLKTSPTGGLDFKIKKYRATDSTYIAQTITFATSAPASTAGTIWVDTSAITTTAQIPMYLGTGSAFIPIPMIVQDYAPVSDPSNGTLWFNDTLSDFALYVEGSNHSFTDQWVPVATTTVSNPTWNQKVISGSPPQFPQLDSIWVDVSTPQNIDNYPVIKKWSGTAWVILDPAAIAITSTDPVASVAVNGTYWLNTGDRLTSYTVKKFDPTFVAKTISFDGTVYSVVTQTGNHWRPNAGTTFGRLAQRQAIVTALQAAITASDEIRSEAVYYQIMAVPGYPELYDDMVSLNTDIGEITFIIGDTPKFLKVSGASAGREILLSDWITNANDAEVTGENGFTSTATPYAAFYAPPGGLGTNLDGLNVFVPSSMIAMRTIAYSDSISAPWFAPAGNPNGQVDNVSSVGYINNLGVYTPVLMTKAQKGIVYDAGINPITFKVTSGDGNGLQIVGQKTMAATNSTLDRIDVARLILKMKYDLQLLLEPYLMKKNDAITQRSALITTERYLAGLKSLRALYDYAARCDDTNNTPDRVAAKQLWVDVAIKPEISIEFIFVPVQVLGPGDELPF